MARNIYLDNKEKKRVTLELYFDPECFDEIKNHFSKDKNMEGQFQKQLELHYDNDFTVTDITGLKKLLTLFYIEETKKTNFFKDILELLKQVNNDEKKSKYITSLKPPIKPPNNILDLKFFHSSTLGSVEKKVLKDNFNQYGNTQLRINLSADDSTLKKDRKRYKEYLKNIIKRELDEYIKKQFSENENLRSIHVFIPMKKDKIFSIDITGEREFISNKKKLEYINSDIHSILYSIIKEIINETSRYETLVEIPKPEPSWFNLNLEIKNKIGDYSKFLKDKSSKESLKFDKKNEYKYLYPPSASSPSIWNVDSQKYCDGNRL